MKTLLTSTRPPSPCYSTTNFRWRRRTTSPLTMPTLLSLTLVLLFSSITSRSPRASVVVVVAAIPPATIQIPSAANNVARGTILRQRQQRQHEREDCDTEKNECRSPESGLCENEVSSTCLVDPCDATECEFGACEANYCGGCHAMCLGAGSGRSEFDRNIEGDSNAEARRKAKESKGGDGDVASDGAAAEETDVRNGVEQLIEEAEGEAGKTTGASSVSSPGIYSAAADNDDDDTTRGRSAWVAHGLVGSAVFGLLVPLAISSAFFRDLIPTYWIYIHVVSNVATFAMTFFAVGIAFATMNGMGNGGEGHLKEMHHIVGLLLLLAVSFQTANGFLRPPREFYTDDEHDTTPGAVLRSSMNDKSMTARTLWYLVHGMSGVLVFALGSYQVRSGLGLFSKRYGTPDWGTVYIAYVGWLAGILLIGKVLMKWKERNSKLSGMGIQMGRGEGSNRGVYDPENDLTVAQFETV
mmetsp:Transcript_12003/g.22849  ORF Transcript_12003/g.22849 Transcript_12003/m.22849 type:complete len:469 (+) Transcript_12003:159-1565(+)